MSVSCVLAQICNEQVAVAEVGFERVVGKLRHALELARHSRGLSQGRSSNSEAPSDTVMVRLSGATIGPSMPESAGGILASSLRRPAALGEEHDALGQAPEQRLEIGALAHQRVERGDHAARRPRRGDAGLMQAIEGLAPAGRANTAPAPRRRRAVGRQRR